MNRELLFLNLWKQLTAKKAYNVGIERPGTGPLE